MDDGRSRKVREDARQDDAPASGVREACPESTRSQAETRVCVDPVDPFAETLATIEPPSSRRRRPEWCVDVGAALWTMTSFELWSAVDRGDVSPSAKVWREGMDCWTPLERLPDFAFAVAARASIVPEARALTPEPATADTLPAPPRPPSLAPAPAPAPRPAGLLARLGRRLHAARWIAAGTAVAIAAITAAILSSPRVRPAPPPLAAATLGGVIGPFSAPAPEALPPSSPPTPRALEPRAPHDERGQRRRPRDGRRAYGW